MLDIRESNGGPAAEKVCLCGGGGRCGCAWGRRTSEWKKIGRRATHGGHIETEAEINEDKLSIGPCAWVYIYIFTICIYVFENDVCLFSSLG